MLEAAVLMAALTAIAAIGACIESIAARRGIARLMNPTTSIAPEGLSADGVRGRVMERAQQFRAKNHSGRLSRGEQGEK